VRGGDYGRVLLVLAALAAIAATAAYAAPGGGIHAPRGNGVPHRHHAPVKKSFLFVLQASRGTLTPLGGKRYELRLRGVDRQSVAFSDRPTRATAVVATRLFLSSWKTEFKKSPPNVALVLPGANPRRDTFVFELGEPKVDAAHRSVAFPARILTSAPSRLAYLRSRLDKSPPRSFGAATLFVDDSDSFNTSYCGATVRNNTSYVLSLPVAGGFTVKDWGNGDVSTELDASTQIGPYKTGSGGVGESTEFYSGCETSTVYNSLPVSSDGSGVNGDVGIYVEYDYTGASQYECVSTGALNISCRFVQSGDSVSTWVTVALDAASFGAAGASLDAVNLIEAASTGSVSVEATISTRGGSQYPVCQASAAHQGCPSLLGGD
jgi:hypothetical protein